MSLDILKTKFPAYIDSLSLPQLKKVISNLNKAVRAEFIIKVRGKSHDDLKEEIKSKWANSAYSTIGLSPVKSIDKTEIEFKPSQNLKKPTKAQIKQAEIEQFMGKLPDISERLQKTMKPEEPKIDMKKRREQWATLTDLSFKKAELQKERKLEEDDEYRSRMERFKKSPSESTKQRVTAEVIEKVNSLPIGKKYRQAVIDIGNYSRFLEKDGWPQNLISKVLLTGSNIKESDFM